MEHKNTPFVSVITVNYRQNNVTLDFLASFTQVDYPAFEIIVVDNAAIGSELQNDISAKFSSFPVSYIRIEANLGFAGGNNVGVKRSKGDYILFINNDTEVPVDILTKLLQVFEKYPDAGMVSPKLLFYESGLIQYAGAIRINALTGRGRKIGFGETDSGQYSETRVTDLGHGAAMMLPRKIIDKVGMMPEIFFLYYEEHDWGEQVKRAGFKIYYCATTFVRHKESMTIGKQSLIKTYYMNRNRLIYVRRNTSGLTKLIALSFYLLLALPKQLAVFALKRQWDHFWEVLKALKWNMSHKSS